MRILDVGCGKNKTKGAIGIDHDRSSAADVIHNLDVYPYPFKDNEFDMIVCNHIIEHVKDVKMFLSELHRIAKPGAAVKGITPHFSNPCAYYDPTHRHYFGAQFLEFFACSVRKNGPVSRLLNKMIECYYPIPLFAERPGFSISNLRLYFPRLLRWTGVGLFANRFPEVYEFYLSGVLRARDIIFELKVLK